MVKAVVMVGRPTSKKGTGAWPRVAGCEGGTGLEKKGTRLRHRRQAWAWMPHHPSVMRGSATGHGGGRQRREPQLTLDAGVDEQALRVVVVYAHSSWTRRYAPGG